MAEQETKTLITWTKKEYGFAGSAGGVRLFIVGWRPRVSGLDWGMRTDLPGLTRKVWEADDREELYRKAEKVLAAWLARVSQTGREAGQ